MTNAQALNETLLQEKAVFDQKIEERDLEIEDVTNKHNHLQTELSKCIQERMNAIKTSKRMRLAEEKAYNEMMEWKTKYNNLEETSQRLQTQLKDAQKQNDNLALENSKLAGHHNAQQRINHLLNLKKECEKLKKEKKQLLNKVSILQKKLGNNTKASTNTLNMSISSMGSMGSTSNDDQESVSSQNEQQKLKEQLIK